MSNDNLVLDSLNRLRSIDPTNLLTGTTLIVKNPGLYLPAGSYTLLDSTLAEFPPIVIAPVVGGTRRWIAHNNVVYSENQPATAPLFVNLEWIRTNKDMYISVNTATSDGWFGIQGLGPGTSVFL